MWGPRTLNADDDDDGHSRTYRVASLRAEPVGRISYNLYFDFNMCGMSLVI